MTQACPHCRLPPTQASASGRQPLRCEACGRRLTRPSPIGDTDDEITPTYPQPSQRTVVARRATAVRADVPRKRPGRTVTPTAFTRAPAASPAVAARPAAAPVPEPARVSRTVIVSLPLFPEDASPAETRPPSRPRPAPAPSSSAGAGEVASSLSENTLLGGYQLQRKLGAGSMGTVWLARQLSLDRDVAVKILRPGLASDPQFVLRFTQEALAAAQLVHHNIAQIYDCGSDKGVHFFSMEYVDDESLLSLVRREGRLAPEVAAGYILQAARGLEFAHDRGMVHRDIKPDNLLLNRDGIVKIADLGLVKHSLATGTRERLPGPGDKRRPGGSYDSASSTESAMGTPAYMAPEQIEDSSAVDGRADIYSLGCTFYHLLTGRPPFEADSSMAVLTMHLVEPPTPPDERVRRVPRFLSQLVMRMLAKRPEQRCASIKEVIRQLEVFLGIDSSRPFSPSEEHANFLESSVQGYNGSRWARRRRWLVRGFALLSLLVTAGLGYKVGTRPALLAGAIASATWMASFLVRGLFQKGALFLRFRRLVLGAPLGTWAVWLALLGGSGWGLYLQGLHTTVLGVLGAGLVGAIGFFILVDRRVAAERRPFIEGVEQMLRTIRLRGLEEGALRQFVCKYSGEHWEAFYEALFGHDAKLEAREKWGRDDRGQPRRKHGAWREPLLRAMDALQASRQHRREQRHLRRLLRSKATARAVTSGRAAVPGR